MTRLTLTLAVALAGCAPGGGPSPTQRMDEPPPMMESDAGARMMMPPPDVPPDTRGDDCAGVAVAAEAEVVPVDVVWVVDSSGSMSGEAERVQDNMNRFADAVLGAGIDPRVVMITEADFIVVPDPLGSDAEHYRFVERDVGSSAPLTRLLSEFPRYADFLRPDAVLHFVAVTDDESNLSATEFHAQMDALLEGREYVFHAIASEDLGGDECPGAADIGAIYYELAATTMGLQVSICTDDWTGVFTRLQEHIFASAPVPCELVIPAPPEDLALDYDRVNVELRSSGGDPTVVPNVGDEGDCVAGGWYYDDPDAPARVHLCPATCEAANSLPDVEIDISFGCDTLLM